jgi:beta-ketoacyl-acyl-carrier-protein synthase II
MVEMAYPSIRRVVITGLGVVAPNGIGKQAFWEACVAGRSGIRPITRFDASLLPTHIAGEVPDFDPAVFGLTRDECEQMDRNTQFALAAAHLAWQDANFAQPLTEEEREQVGVYMGSAMASVEAGERAWLELTDTGARPVREVEAVHMPATLFLNHSPAAAVAVHHQLHGPCMVLSTGCSAGADAIGQAFWAIQEGRADRMLAGGSDSSISYSSLGAFNVIGALSTRNEAPERASRPYDGQRNGFVMAEGAGVLLLEARDLALARGARIYAELVGFVSNSNAYHMTSLPEDGMPLQNLLRQILAEAAITPEQLGYINSHGSSTPTNDSAETAAYKAVFGEQAYAIPISSTKSMIGHTQGAASAIEAVVTALALHEHILPPTINQEHPDPACDLDYIPNTARPSVIRLALTHSSGFGGVNTALLLAEPDWVDGRLAGKR